MNPDTSSSNTYTTHTKLPIGWQLGVLGLIFLGLFGVLWWQQQSRGESEDLAAAPPASAQVNTTFTPSVPQKIEHVEILAQAAFVFDVSEQRVLFSKNADHALPLASITKLMTTLLAHELVAEDRQTTLSPAAILQEGDSGLSAGERVRIDALQKIALIASSNDAAYALAASVGSLLGEDDPENQFVTGMNIRAEELGLKTMAFKNPTGLDISVSEPGAVGSAREVSFLLEYMLTHYPELLESTRELETRVYNVDGDYHTITNTNEDVLGIPNLIASKTGFTDLAGGNLTVAFDIGLNRPIIITVLGSSRDGRFSDVKKLATAVTDSLQSE
ncbi:MAG: hypothetical protein AAB388_01665 [Patescibacteria group bacterium]